MKAAVAVIVALLIGLVLGSWSVKTDLRKARSEIADLKKEIKRRGGRAGSLDGVTAMLKIPERAEAGAARPPSADSPPSAAVLPGTGDVVRADVAAPAPGKSPAADRPDDRAAMRARIDTAVGLWKTRSDLARNSFVSNVSTSSVQTAQFDTVMTAMNLRISNSIRSWVDFIQDERQITPETGVRMMSDLGGVVVRAYDDLDGVLPPDWRVKAGREFQVFDFINPEVALPLADIENLLETMGPGHTHRPFPGPPHAPKDGP